MLKPNGQGKEGASLRRSLFLPKKDSEKTKINKNEKSFYRNSARFVRAVPTVQRLKNRIKRVLITKFVENIEKFFRKDLIS